MTKRWRWGMAFLALGILAVMLWLMLQPEPPSPGVLAVNGRIEGDQAAVGAKVSGKMVRLPVRKPVDRLTLFQDSSPVPHCRKQLYDNSLESFDSIEKHVKSVNLRLGSVRRPPIGTIPLEDFCRDQQIPLSDRVRQEIDQQVRRAAYTIIEGKGATYYGIGSALAHIVDVILDDQRAILTVCTPMPEVVGVTDVTTALPHLIGAQGSLGTLPLPLTATEGAALYASVRVTQQALEALGGGE